MRISILCSKDHPIYPRLKQWRDGSSHNVKLIQWTEDLPGGDILFLISCGELISSKVRDLYTHSLVIHASDLPDYKGWSPHIWQILEGKKEVWVSLLDADLKLDSGDIWEQEKIKFEGHELFDEINDLLFDAEIDLMDFAVQHHILIQPTKQVGMGSYWRKRTPADSELDVDKTIAEQFNLLRVADPKRYPAFFKMHGFTYEVSIKKV